MVDPPGNDDDHGDLDALDFSAAHTNEASPLDALDDYAPVQTDDAEGDLDALHALTERDEVLDPVATPEATSEETPTWQAIIASVPASAVRLTERSKLAKQLLIGYVTSGTLILAAGAIAVVVRGHFFVHSLVVAGLITTVCGFRSRLYAERWCAWALLAATVAIPTGLTAKLIIWYPHYAWLLLSVYLTVALVALVVVGSMAHVRRVSPVVKRTLELIDGAMIAAIIPMLLWITGVYDTVRNIRF